MNVSGKMLILGSILWPKENQNQWEPCGKPPGKWSSGFIYSLILVSVYGSASLFDDQDKKLSSDFLEERQAKAFSLVQNFKCLFQILCVPGVIQQDRAVSSGVPDISFQACLCFLQTCLGLVLRCWARCPHPYSTTVFLMWLCAGKRRVWLPRDR